MADPQEGPAQIDASMQAAPAELESASVITRFGAIFVDGLILGLIGFVCGIALPALEGILGIAIPLAYYTYMIGSSGQTVGKKLLKVKVVTLEGGPVGYGSAFLRAIGYWISALVIGIGYLMAFFTDKNRALHDFMAGTRVIKVG